MCGRIAIRNDGLVKPMPTACRRIAYRRLLTPTESTRVAAGVVPAEMEERWFVFLEGDRLYFHRSWTGFCIFEVTVARRDRCIEILDAVVNTDPEQFHPGEDEDLPALLDTLIEEVLLRSWEQEPGT